MDKNRKLIDIDKKTLHILEKEAKRQKRSLKSYLEYTLEETAKRLEEPSAEYKSMMDDMLNRLEKGTLETDSIEKIQERYGI